MAYVPKILAFTGSTRTGSFNKKLVKVASLMSASSGRVGRAARIGACPIDPLETIPVKHHRDYLRGGDRSSAAIAYDGPIFNVRKDVYR